MYRILAFVAVVVAAVNPSLAAQQTGPKTVPAPRAAAATADPSPTNMVPRLLPGTKTNVFSSIQGSALNSTNGPMPNTVMRLRDARFGRIVDTVTTDKSGLFTFRGIDPGSYVVEMMDPSNEAVLAATPIINVGSGQAASTILKLPFKIRPFAGVLGHTMPSALAVASAAAASGVLAESVAGAPATNRALPGQ
jgi:prealbumin domain-containing protein